METPNPSPLVDQLQPEPSDSRIETKPPANPWRLIIDLLETILLGVILYAGINLLSARIRVESISMEPTLRPGDYVMVSKLAYINAMPGRGDVVVFHFPADPAQQYIKRVIGLPGDNVEIREGEVYVNGARLDEPYLKAAPNYSDLWVVPADALFVLGDNRNRSSDSHLWGMVPLENVIGKALIIYWPINRIGAIHGLSS